MRTTDLGKVILYYGDKMMKKRSSIVVLIPILIMIFVFLGCNTSVPQGSNIISRKYETDYEDYFNYLQPYLECMDVDAYYETEYCVKKRSTSG